MNALMDRLRAFMVDCDRVKQELTKVFDALDWEQVFLRMDDEEDYTPIPKNWREQYQDQTILDEAYKQIVLLRDESFTELYWKAWNKSQDTFNHFYGILKKEFLDFDEDLRPTFLMCEECQHISTSVEKGREHKCRINSEDAHKRDNCRFACNKCRYYTNSPDYHKRHLKSKDHLEKMGTPKQTCFTCETCNKDFRFKSEMERHANTCKVKEEQKCTKCNKEFRFKSERERHELCCKEKQEYSCVKCDRTFAFKSEYERHLTTLRHKK